MEFSRITKIAGFSLVGFVAASIVADKVNVGPGISQLAAGAGAALGTLVGGLQRKRRRKPEKAASAQPSESEPEI